VQVLFSVEAPWISWLIQERALSNIFTCQCHGLALLEGSVDVMFPSVVLMFTVSYHSLSTADVVTEQVYFMYEVPWFCSSVLGVTTYQSVLLCEMVYIVLYINFVKLIVINCKMNEIYINCEGEIVMTDYSKIVFYV